LFTFKKGLVYANQRISLKDFLVKNADMIENYKLIVFVWKMLKHTQVKLNVKSINLPISLLFDFF